VNTRPTWWLWWRLIAFRPRLYLINLFCITAVFALAAVPGLVAQQFFARLQASPNTVLGETLPWLVALLVVSALGRGAFLVGCQLTNAPFALSGTALLQKNLLARIFELPGARALPSSPGEAISRFRDDVDDAAWLLIGINDLVAVTIFMGITFAILVRVNALVTVVVFVPLVAVVLIANQARHRIETYRRASREATAEVTGFLAEVFGAAQAVQVANADVAIVGHFRRLNAVRLRATVRDRLFDQVIRSIFLNTVNLGTGVILLVAGRAMQAGTFTVADFALFVYFLGWISEFATWAGTMIARYRQAAVSFSRLLTLLSGASVDQAVANGEIYTSGPLPPIPALTAIEGDRLTTLEVRGLSYAYPETGRGVSDVSFTLARGSFTVITGRIGSGKTTLLRTILGLLSRGAGDVFWNGRPVEDPDSFFVPPRSAYTPQIPRLFSDTLRNNLLLGLPEAEGVLQEALRLSVLDRDVANMSDGLDTRIGTRGVRLSGGQAQRAAAARMFARSTELLVVDDVSSALDVETEQALWERVLAKPGITILAVSHRPAVLRRADQIVVLSEGKVEAIGEYAEVGSRISAT